MTDVTFVNIKTDRLFIQFWQNGPDSFPIGVCYENLTIDVVINDFDSITALACKLQKVNSVQFGHQASFISQNTPRPEKRSLMGEFIFKNYAPAPKNIGLHFDQYDSFIHPPIIKDEIVNANPKNLNHITVYLPSFDKECLEKALKNNQ